MKVYRGSRGIAHLILNLGTRAVSGFLHAQAASPPGKDPSAHWTGGWLGSIASVDGSGEKSLGPTGIRTPDQTFLRIQYEVTS
jgi:hypothetical protein